MNRLEGLRRIAPAERALRQALLIAINGRYVAGTTLRASLPDDLPSQLCWFRCGDGFRFAICLFLGEPVRFPPHDGAAAAEWLERAEELIRTVEHALEIELEPAEIVQEPVPDDCLAMRIDALGEGALRHRLFLAVPRGDSVRGAPAPFAPELVGDVAVEADLMLEGPRLAPHDAADLATGDLLLLGGSRLSAQLHTGVRPPMQGTFDPRSRTFHAIPHDRSMP